MNEAREKSMEQLNTLVDKVREEAGDEAAPLFEAPAICGPGGALKQEMKGRVAYIGGEIGKVVIDPDEITLNSFQAKPEKQEEMRGLVRSRFSSNRLSMELFHNIFLSWPMSAENIPLSRSKYL